jgi:uncharacterized SAM-binding protein YcdF (DUF218 family)
VTRAGRLLAVAAGLVLAAFVAGFVVFAVAIARFKPTVGAQADGIVVLTGGERRLSVGASLLSDNRGKRLLISGANPIATRRDLFRIFKQTGLSAALFKCCVDVGYDANDTSGNASETRAWATANHFSRLIIVTSSYHMPRSLAEFGRAMPEATIVPYPVLPRRSRYWWADPVKARVIFFEYVKFIPSAARLAVTRLTSWDGGTVAGSTEVRASPGRGAR